jgi:hypothetical protein
MIGQTGCGQVAELQPIVSGPRGWIHGKHDDGASPRLEGAAAFKLAVACRAGLPLASWAAVGMYRLLPLVLIAGGVVLAIRRVWVLAAVLIVMAVFGVWLMSVYDR